MTPPCMGDTFPLQTMTGHLFEREMRLHNTVTEMILDLSSIANSASSSILRLIDDHLSALNLHHSSLRTLPQLKRPSSGSPLDIKNKQKGHPAITFLPACFFELDEVLAGKLIRFTRPFHIKRVAWIAFF